MKYTAYTLLILSLFVSVNLRAEDRFTRSEYIELWADEALYQMVTYKIPASITLAQGILESADGNSDLAKRSNNHFGIKCHSTWTGKKVYHDDDKRQECFRKYDNAGDSFEDHSVFLQGRRYEVLFTHKITDYKAWAKGLKKCGYATNSKYANLLIRIIEENHLADYDKVGVKMMKKGEIPNREPARKKKVRDRDKKEKINYDRNDDLPGVTVELNSTISLSENNIKFIIAKAGDSFESIALNLDMMPWQIWKYNDLKKGDKIHEGQRLYIQPKRNKAKKSTHIVQDGESMWSISQHHGVKLKKLYKRNMMTMGSDVKSGQKIQLR